MATAAKVTKNEESKPTGAQIYKLNTKGVTPDVRIMSEMIHNTMLMRYDMIRQLTESRRDIDRECQYKPTLTVDDFYRAYKRQGLAGRVVRFEPDECWAQHPLIYESEEQEDTAFDKGIDALTKEHNLLHYMHRVDVLSGIGHYGIMLIGVEGGGRDLARPLPGITDRWTPSSLFSPEEESTTTTAVPPSQTGTEPVSSEGGASPEGAKRLLYIRVFDETQAKIKELETDESNPRYGLPKMYEIQMADLKDSTKVVTQSKSVNVHWSRVIHIADNRMTSEVMGTPRMEDVFDYLFDAKKVLGANGEGYWKGGFPGISLETHPGLEDVQFGTEELEETRKHVQDYMNGMQRFLINVGMKANTLNAQLADPTPHLGAQITAICITKGWPKRKFEGSEEGKLASGQDMVSHNTRMNRRQDEYLTPMLVRNVIDRFIAVGVLPKPAKRYEVYWPDLNAPSDDAKATTAAKLTDAIAKYIQSDGASLIPPLEFLTKIIGLEQDEAEAIIKAAAEEIQKFVDDEDGEDGESQIGRKPKEPKPDPDLMGGGAAAGGRIGKTPSKDVPRTQ